MRLTPTHATHGSIGETQSSRGAGSNSIPALCTNQGLNLASAEEGGSI
jgi:hypothetical protein